MFRQTCLIVVAVVTLVGSAGAVRATQQTVTVGQTVVSWSGDWEYDPTSSMSEQVTLSQVDPVTQSIKLATYGEFADNTVSSPEQALDAFATAFFEGAGVEGVTPTTSGSLPSGGVWKAHTFDLQGLNLTILLTVSQTIGGEYVVSTITGNTDGFAATITLAQGEILLNGAPVFVAGIDPAVVTGEASADTSQPPTGRRLPDLGRRVSVPDAAATPPGAATPQSDASLVGGDGSSRDAPIPVGQAGTIGDWEVAVVSVTPNANDIVAAENQFNEAAAPGTQFSIATVRVTYTGTDTGNPAFDLNFQAVGAKNVSYTTFNNTCGVVPNDPIFLNEMFAGGTADFNVCWEVASDDVSSLQMYVEELFAVDDDPVWFSLQ